MVVALFRKVLSITAVLGQFCLSASTIQASAGLRYQWTAVNHRQLSNALKITSSCEDWQW